MIIHTSLSVQSRYNDNWHVINNLIRYKYLNFWQNLYKRRREKFAKKNVFNETFSFLKNRFKENRIDWKSHENKILYLRNFITHPFRTLLAKFFNAIPGIRVPFVSIWSLLVHKYVQLSGRVGHWVRFYAKSIAFAAVLSFNVRIDINPRARFYINRPLIGAD